METGVDNSGRRGRRVVIVRSAEAGLVVAAADPGAVVQVFESDWDAVDRGRARAEAMGLAERVHIHHAVGGRARSSCWGGPHQRRSA